MSDESVKFTYYDPLTPAAEPPKSGQPQFTFYEAPSPLAEPPKPETPKPQGEHGALRGYPGSVMVEPGRIELRPKK